MTEMQFPPFSQYHWYLYTDTYAARTIYVYRFSPQQSEYESVEVKLQLYTLKFMILSKYSYFLEIR